MKDEEFEMETVTETEVLSAFFVICPIYGVLQNRLYS
jgi:hypothetical protein